MAQGQGILLIRLKSMGDILFTLPAVHAVRAAFPDRAISFLVSQEHAPLLEGFPRIDHILPLDRGRFRRPNPVGIFAEAFGLLRKLRPGRFSLVVDFQGYGETAAFTWITRARERWGSVYRPSRAWAYTRPCPRNARLHPADAHLELVAPCLKTASTPRNEFVLPDSAIKAAARFFAEHELQPTRPSLFIQPFTSSAEKNWPLEQHLALASRARERGFQVLFGGGPEDRPRLAAAAAAGFVVAAGTPILVSASLVKLSSLVVGGDTGLLHLAVALGKRTVMLMNSLAPGSAHPFRRPDWALTPPAGNGLSGIPLSQVEQACWEAAPEGSIRPGGTNRN
jgi:ADP-heptose:LPS heptosyltransferase